MYNFYLIAYKPELNEPVFERFMLTEEDAAAAGYEKFAEYCHAVLTHITQECEASEARFILLNQEEYMKLVIRMGEKIL
jgi:hypothetical protein